MVYDSVSKAALWCVLLRKYGVLDVMIELTYIYGPFIMVRMPATVTVSGERSDLSISRTHIFPSIPSIQFGTE